MSTRRSNISPEYTQKMRSRRITNNRFGEVAYGLLQIDRSFYQLNDKQNELYRYFPMALFACLETWVRMAICELVNFGEPFRDNARDLMKDKKIDYDTMVEIDKDMFTVGDIVSFSQSVSKLHHIYNIMDVLLGEKFRNRIETACNSGGREGASDRDDELIIADIKETCWWVKRMIELRHVFCHETAANTIVKKIEVEQCIKHTKIFIHASNNVLESVLRTEDPLTQAEIIERDREKINESRELLDEVIKKVSKLLSGRQVQLFVEANGAWKHYFSKSVEMEGLAHKEETVRKREEAKIEKRLIDQRIEQLNNLYNMLNPLAGLVIPPKRQV